MDRAYSFSLAADETRALQGDILLGTGKKKKMITINFVDLLASSQWLGLFTVLLPCAPGPALVSGLYRRHPEFSTFYYIFTKLTSRPDRINIGYTAGPVERSVEMITAVMGIVALGLLPPAPFVKPGSAGAGYVSSKLRRPVWTPIYDMSASSCVMPCNYSGFYHLDDLEGFGHMQFDWSNRKDLWCNDKP